MTVEIGGESGSTKKATLKSVLDRIRADCTEWNAQNRFYQLLEMEKRRSCALTKRELLRCISGVFFLPGFSRAHTIYLFEGLRNAAYMESFDKRSVFVIGSHAERAFAESKGYGFIWSFPAEAAVRATVYRGWKFFLYVQMLAWRRALRAKKGVVFFLYEDTQPLGTFVVHMTRHLLTNSRTVCIQHGYFSALKQPLRYEGVLSEINFVWDSRQRQLMGLDPDRSFLIGLPYSAKAGSAKRLSVVLVGVGAPHGDPNTYNFALNAFCALAKLAEEELGLDVVYRPHPNESAHPEVLEILRRRFRSVDKLGKLERLNAAQSVYVGTVSSLLYEAKQAGHFVVSIRMDREEPVFDSDLILDPGKLEPFAVWARGIMSRQASAIPPENTEPASGDVHLARFRNAVVEAKLPLC